MTTDQHNQVVELVRSTVSKAKEMWPMLKMPEIEVKTNLRGLTAGQAISKWTGIPSATLRINTKLFDFGIEQVEETVVHEVAHIVANFLHKTNCGHGFMWANVMRKFGKAPTRCHRLPLEPARKISRYAVACCGQDWRITKNMYNKLISNTKMASCPKCRRRFDTQEFKKCC